MTDIIIILPSIFNIIKSDIEINEKIKKKYVDIYAKYACFSQILLPPPSTALPHKHPIRKIYNTRPIRIINLKKQILGILNIINESNYLKLFNRLKLIITSDNITYIITELLQKCALQIFYVDIFIKLFINIYEFIQKDDKQIVINIINKYVYDFIEKKEYILVEDVIIKNNTKYDDFCASQKHKALINAKNLIIIYLFKYKLIELSEHDYFTFIVNELNKCENESEIELLLNVVLTIQKYRPAIRLNINFKDILNKTSNKKIKFMINDINK
jgi:hypothetical protein